MKNNCYINVKVLFENVCVRLYPPFPTTRQEQVSYEALKISHTFSMAIQAHKHVYNMKTCLFQYKTIGSEHMFSSLILLYLVGAQVNPYGL